MALTKTNIPGYMKDLNSNLVLNRNSHEYEQYQAGRRKIIEINNLNKKVNEMGSELTEIKTMLHQLLDKASK